MVHGGAGRLHGGEEARLEEIKAALGEACGLGLTVLREHGSALDAVERTVAHLEACGQFNAGLGSCLTINKQTEMDAGIMDGRTLATGAVGCVSRTANPITVARRVMELTPHALLVGESATAFANKCGLMTGDIPITEEKLRRYEKEVEEMRRSSDLRKARWLPEYGTVGAVALDAKGGTAAGVSTGGLWLKLPGRIGDSAIVGAGFYADEGGAAAATGSGEEIMRLVLSKYACDLMKAGSSAGEACHAAIKLLTERSGQGTGGIIAIDLRGNVGYSFNTEGLPRAYYMSGMKEIAIELFR